MPKGWYFDRMKHSLASKGIPSRGIQSNFNAKGNSEIKDLGLFYDRKIISFNRKTYMYELYTIPDDGGEDDEFINKFYYILDNFYNEHHMYAYNKDVSEHVTIELETDKADNYPEYEPHQAGYSTYEYISGINISSSYSNDKIRIFLEAFDNYLQHHNFKGTLDIREVSEKDRKKMLKLLRYGKV